ncbi:hypothetical protein F7734_57380 [Scytonema sp. UIC 10036]|uniref:hypothetical protein n=1 Tax=Scytonema sp. UIC 10036 TaxID=2304196 RepID=UPI0012DAB7E3|nr:hypothetical protein [Scytonema sp. UIC 10036]MUH01345.1 hypothetical protein [Scytonema sp. UIC 10036]
MNGKYLAFIGTAIALAFSSNVAVAQGAEIERIAQGGQPSTAKPFKLSPEGKKILCQNFPLNSACQAGGAGTTQTPSSGQSNPSGSSETPGTATPGTAPAEPGTVNTPDGTRDVAPPPTGTTGTDGSGTQITPPAGTTGAPDSTQPEGTNQDSANPDDSKVTPGTAPAEPGTTNTPDGTTETTPSDGPGGTTTPSTTPGSGTTSPR